MPTGYTAKILEGATFEEFVWGAARAMGAFIQRDDRMDAPPELEEKPDSYHRNALVKAISERDRLESLTSDQWRQEWKASIDAERKHNAEYIARKQEERSKYEAMLDRVLAWKPPTPDHDGFKKFMVDQIRESIRFDCPPSDNDEGTEESFEEYRTRKMERATKDVDYHRENLATDIERAAARNEWKADLLASVPLPMVKKTRRIAAGV